MMPGEATWPEPASLRSPPVLPDRLRRALLATIPERRTPGRVPCPGRRREGTGRKGSVSNPVKFTLSLQSLILEQLGRRQVLLRVAAGLLGLWLLRPPGLLAVLRQAHP